MGPGAWQSADIGKKLPWGARNANLAGAMPKYAKPGQLRRLTVLSAWVLRDADGRGGQVVDARVVPLLRAIARLGTLAAAAPAAGVPYRTAWAVLEQAEEEIGAPLVELTRGRGASLTPFARHWLAADEEAMGALAFVPALDAEPARVRAAPKPAPPLRIAASHDIALAQLRDRWRVAHGVALEFHGSAESLDAWHAGQADLAGFHVTVDGHSSHERDPLLARLDRTRDAVLPFISRVQGLILPRGNPRRVKSVPDIAAKRLKIVNRQPGSGTRILFDRLLARAGIDPASLPGYTNEEFTHAAVAATVAAGKAEAGFGIQAAAAQFGLAFVPVVSERYLFACRRRVLGTPRVAAFRALLASPATRAVVTPMPGYALEATDAPAGAPVDAAVNAAVDTAVERGAAKPRRRIMVPELR
jgi:molybdate transport repressor ModE-like protein